MERDAAADARLVVGSLRGLLRSREHVAARRLGHAVLHELAWRARSADPAGDAVHTLPPDPCAAVAAGSGQCISLGELALPAAETDAAARLNSAVRACWHDAPRTSATAEASAAGPVRPASLVPHPGSDTQKNV